jgi:alkylhydroperoxidase family enzyme
MREGKPFVPALDYENSEGEARFEWDRQVARHGRMTNMKRTLAHSSVALKAMLSWYPLHDSVVSFLGPRLATAFCYAISTGSDCLLCSTYFRRLLSEAGEDPSQLQLDARERVVVDFGTQIAKGGNCIVREQIDALSQYFTAAEIVTLTAFGAQMVATTVFNSVLNVELDDYLLPYSLNERLELTSTPK